MACVAAQSITKQGVLLLMLLPLLFLSASAGPACPAVEAPSVQLLPSTGKPHLNAVQGCYTQRLIVTNMLAPAQLAARLVVRMTAAACAESIAAEYTAHVH
jgi:hypothetical protein